MSFFVNLGYSFTISKGTNPTGSMILASALPMHQLERRKFKDLHLKARWFDSQLYMSSLDSAVAIDHCSKLASYPWFGVNDLKEYQSALQTQKSWMDFAKANIRDIWKGNIPDSPPTIQLGVRESIDLQRRIGCCGVILPSPLTIEPGTNYQAELLWLDAGLDYFRKLNDCHLPVYATVALSDVCIRFSEPQENSLLELILDAVSAREVDGVYIIVEQASERDDARHCANSRALRSVLHLVHAFSKDANLDVGVNFVGAFGLACKAAGAKWWASNWYKSLYRVRLADKVAGGRAFPSYWSYPIASDIHLDSNFDHIVEARLLSKIIDNTNACSGLLQAAQQFQSTKNVPAWAYRMSNVTAAREHYLLSIISQNLTLDTLTLDDQLNEVEKWLVNASSDCDAIDSILGDSSKTNTDHVRAWKEAFTAYRRDHKV
jgi:hypothetical protein